MTTTIVIAIMTIGYLVNRLSKLEDTLAEQKTRYGIVKEALADSNKLKDALEEKSYNIEHGLMNILRENKQLMKYVNEFRTLDLDLYKNHELPRLKKDIEELQNKEVYIEEITEDQTVLPVDGGLS